jgi:hypothetical protein
MVMLRDPVERYLSGRTHAERYREESLAAGSTDESFTRRAVETAFQRGMYATQLGWILDAFPREQVMAIQYERCNDDPIGELGRTFAFLGLPPHIPAEQLLSRQVNAARIEKVPIEPERQELIARLYQPEVERLKQLVPELDLALWPSFAHLA